MLHFHNIIQPLELENDSNNSILFKTIVRCLEQQIIFFIIIEWITMMGFGKCFLECLSESNFARKEKYIDYER